MNDKVPFTNLLERRTRTPLSYIINIEVSYRRVNSASLTIIRVRHTLASAIANNYLTTIALIVEVVVHVRKSIRYMPNTRMLLSRVQLSYCISGVR